MAETTRFLPAHCRAARALLELTQEELAKKAGIGRMTVKRFEASEGVRAAQAAMIRHVLEEAGAVFLDEGVKINETAISVGVGLALQKR